MSDPIAVLLQGAMSSLAVAPADLASAMANPTFLPLLNQSLATIASKPQPQKLEIFEGNVPEIKRRIARAKAEIERDKLLPVVELPFISREEDIAAVEAKREAVLRHHALGLETYLTGVSKPFSETHISQLRRIRRADMGVPKRHDGCWLPGRIISAPVKTGEVVFVIEDSTGQSAVLSCRHLDLDGADTGTDLDALFSLGQQVAVREPVVKHEHGAEGFRVIVESPSDVIFLEPNNSLLAGIQWSNPSPATPLPPSFDHKAHGNGLFKQKKYPLAIKAYSDGLSSSSSPEQNLLLQLNRSQTHLFLNYCAAYRDTCAVLSGLVSGVEAPPQTKLKATLRQARALEGLRKLEMALASYEAVFKLDPAAAEGKDGMRRVKKMLAESKTGVFDWAKREKVRLTDATESFVGDFFGPIEVVELATRGGGRGVVATRDIEAGEVVLVEKAFATGLPSKSGPLTVMALKLALKKAEKASDVALTESVVARILDDPSVAPLLYSLYGGPTFKPHSTAPIDSLARRKVSKVQYPAKVDIARIEGISTQNAFSLREEKNSTSTLDGASGLFLTASLFNHSDAANVTWTTHRDYTVLRARAGVKKGSELFVRYYPLEVDSTERENVIKTHFENGCECDYCEDDRRDGPSNVAKRRELMDKRWPPLKKAFSALGPKSKMEELDALKVKVAFFVRDLEKTYRPDHGPVKPDLALPYHNLAELHVPSRSSFHKDANPFSLKSLVVSGAEFDIIEERIKVLAVPYNGDNSVAMILNMAWRLTTAGTDEATDEAERWVSAAAQTARILHGDSPKRFAERYARTIEGYGLEWMVGLLMIPELDS